MVSTATNPSRFSTLNHEPISSACDDVGRWNALQSFHASPRISVMLLMKASSGASGKEGENSAM